MRKDLLRAKIVERRNEGGPMPADIDIWWRTPELHPWWLRVTLDGVVHVYARSAGMELVEFVPDGLGGRLWNAYNHTTGETGQTIAGDPSVLKGT
jgi:hypothetical protein